MKKILACLLLLVFMTPFAVRANEVVIGNETRDYDPVADVMATEVSDDEVEVVWSWSTIPWIEDFETGNFNMFPWDNEVSNYPWEVTTTNAYEGTYCMKSTNTGVDNSTSAIEITVNIPRDGLLSFYVKISGEIFDDGSFYIDGEQVAIFDGDRDWIKREFEVTEGYHTLRWEYHKDSMEAFGDDCMYVDYIDFKYEPEPVEPGLLFYDDGIVITNEGWNGGTWWGVMFPSTMLSGHEGESLTKVLAHGYNILGDYTTEGEYNLKICQGGDTAPETEVHTQSFMMTGEIDWKEVELTTPVEVDVTKNLWVLLNSETVGFPMVYGADNDPEGEPNGSWIYLDSLQDGNYSWMNIDRIFYRPITWMIRAYVESPDAKDGGMMLALDSEEREQVAVDSYKIYRAKRNNEEATAELLETVTNVTDTVYNDMSWATTPYGEYKYGVMVVYEDGVESPILWSNSLEKDVWTTLDITVTTDVGNPSGTKVELVNVSEPEMGFDYEVVLDGSGYYAWDKVRKGTYLYTVHKDGYTSNVEGETIEIEEPTSLECELEEMIEGISDLYVSPTGWAMWSGATAGGADVTFNFDDGMQGWTTIDADGDENAWKHTSEITYLTITPHNGSAGCVFSESFSNETGLLLTPDNYLVSPQMYKMGENQVFSFYVCAQDKEWAAEHYGVAVSTSGTNPEDFKMVWEETLTAKNTGNTRDARGTREQGNWYHKTIDLSEFAGQEVYIAFRHFDCENMFLLNIDDVVLTNAAKDVRALDAYKVMLNGEVEAEVMTPYFQHDVTNLVEGQQYTTSVAAVYTSGDSDYVDYTWTYSDCSNYEGYYPEATVNGKTVTLTWTDTPPAPEGEDNFMFDFEVGTLDGWTTIDADGDGYNWVNSIASGGGAPGYETFYCAYSQSYNNESGALTPDNYLVTAEKYEIKEGSTLSFYVAAQDAAWPAEHYGVAISTTGNTDAADFTTIWEETLTAKNAGVAKAERGMNGQGNWYYKTIDLSDYAGQAVYIALRHFNCSDMFYILIDNVSLTAGKRAATSELGVFVFRDGKLLTSTPITDSYVDENVLAGEHTYCVRTVYDDYSMSCIECTSVEVGIECMSPEDLYGESVVKSDGTYGVNLIWPYSSDYGWLYYDNGTFSNNLGLGEGKPLYWGVMFPSTMIGSGYDGSSLSKVQVYDIKPGEYTLNIYYGGTTAPDLLVHSQDFNMSGANKWNDVELSNPLPLDVTQNLWVTIYSTGIDYPAAYSENTGDANGRWISFDGTEWFDVMTQISGTFMVRAFVTDAVKGGEIVELPDFEGEASTGELVAEGLTEPVATANRSLTHYNIYRGTSNNNYEFIDEVDAVGGLVKYYDDLTDNPGTYYYQVTAVYEENGVTCESEPATSYLNPDQDYVTVEVTNVVENGSINVAVYPNPTKGDLRIEAEGMNRITVTSILGQVMMDKAVDGNNAIIDMSQLEAGVYMIQIVSESGMTVKRINVIK